MSDTVDAKQARYLWQLLATGGQGPMPRSGPLREALLRSGLVRKGYRAGGRTVFAVVTDRGWNWADRHLDDPDAVPKPLQPWFAVVKRYLDAQDLGLAALFVPPPEALSPTPVKLPTAADLRRRIGAAYLALTDGRTNQSVPLARLREALADLDRATVDKGLARILKGDRKARLSQISDHRSLTVADREAAYAPAGEPFHLIWIHA